MPKRNKPNLVDLKNQRRIATFDHSTIDVEARTVELAFSSEEPVRTWYGYEVLSHEPGAVRLGRLNDGGALLWMHQWGEQLGVVEVASIDSDRKGRAIVRFGKSAFAEEKFQDVLDKILRHVSVGYHIHSMYCDNPDVLNDDELRYVADDWEPIEISMATVPADTGVGVGRSMGGAEPEQLNNLNLDKEGKRMPKSNELPVEPVSVQVVENGTNAERALGNAKNVVASMMALGRAYAAHNGIELAAAAIERGESQEQLQGRIMEGMKSQMTRTDDAHLDLTAAETGRYSLLRALNASVTGDWSKAGFERECSNALAAQFKRTPNGLFLPVQALMRDYQVGVPAQGGALVANELRPQDFIELLRNRLAITNMGATVIDGLVGDVTIPKQTAGAAYSWVGENEAADESSAKFSDIKLTPKTIASKTQLSRQFIQQSSLGAEAFAQQELLKTMLQGLDHGALFGTGAGKQPTGLFNTTGVNAVETGGAALTWGHIVDLEGKVADSNADYGNLGYLTNTKVRSQLKKTLKSDGVSGYIWEDGLTPLNGYRAEVSNQVPSNLGDGKDHSAMIYGNFSELILAYWGVLDILVNPYKSDDGSILVTAFQDVDTVVRHPESFSIVRDIKA